MFLEHFGLIEQPFGVTPDPRFLHLGSTHREALASLVYGTEENRGFLALIAKPGMGKTTLLYQYLEGLRSRARSAFLFHTEGDARALMRHLLLDVGIDASGKDLASMHGMLNRFLVEEMNAGRRFILVIDEAQNLDERVLEFVRLLSNFETPWKKLMHIVIAGQPQLAEKLAAHSMEQLRQRISSVIRLNPLSAEETAAYIRHRLWIGGHTGPSLFTVGAQLLIAQKSAGIPRVINNLCFQSMSLAFALGRKQVDSLMVREAVSDLELEPAAPKPQSAIFSHHRIFSGSKPVPPAKSQTRTAVRRKWPLVASAAAIFVGALLFNAFGGARKVGMHHLWLNTFNRVKSEVARLAPRAGASSNQTPGNSPASPYGLATFRPDLPPNPIESAHASKESGILTVTVQKDDTLRHLSLEYLGRFDVASLIEISSLNPSIVDPNHIEVGQQIRMPIYLRLTDSALSEATAATPAVAVLGEKP